METNTPQKTKANTCLFKHDVQVKDRRIQCVRLGKKKAYEESPIAKQL